jgi:hypothetical protein
LVRHILAFQVFVCLTQVVYVSQNESQANQGKILFF